MAELIRDTSDLRTIVGGAVSGSVTWESMAPYLGAASAHILPWITRSFYNNLRDSPPTASQTLLQEAVRQIRRPLAYLLVYEYSKVGGVQFNDQGLIRVEGESHRTAFKYQETMWRQSLLVNGYQALEDCVEWLTEQYQASEDNRTKLALWKDNGGLDMSRGLILNSSEQIRQHFGKEISRYAFEGLRPLLSDVETFGIKPAFPRAFYDSLKANLLTGQLTPGQKAILPKLRSALASWLMREAIQRQWVSFDGISVVFRELADEQGLHTQRAADRQSVSAWLNRESCWGDRHMSDARAYIYDNKADFELIFQGADAWPADPPEMFPAPEEEPMPRTRYLGHDIGFPGPAKGIVRI